MSVIGVHEPVRKHELLRSLVPTFTGRLIQARASVLACFTPLPWSKARPYSYIAGDNLPRLPI